MPPIKGSSVPVVTSHASNLTVHTRFLLVSGQCGGTAGTGSNNTATGYLYVYAHKNQFPAQTFPVSSNGQFKALLHLSPGENIITLQHDNNLNSSSIFTATYIPLLQNPPLQLAIILARDSPERFDDVPGCTEPNTLDTACRRIRFAAYLWQAYTAAEMHRQGFGPRAFPLEEAWMPDSLSAFGGGARTTAIVHIVRSKYSTAEIRDIRRAQQGGTSDKLQPDLFGIALEALRSYFPTSVQQQQRYVAAMFLDSTRDPKTGRIVGHAAVGGGAGNISLAIFGSHSLFAWPSTLEALIPALNDTRPVDQRYCGIDAEGKTYWMAANVGIGAWMHEVGHLFGCPHQESGVMLRCYPRLNRSFCAIEPSPSQNKVEWGECRWHALDVLRFVRHPCFTLPSDPAQPVEDFAHTSINVFGAEDGLHIACAAGILLIELYDAGGGREFPKTHFSFANAHPPPTEHVISHATLNSVSPGKGTEPGRVRAQIFSCASGVEPVDVPDVGALLHTVRDAALGGAVVRRTAKFGSAPGPPCAVRIPYPLASIRVHSGLALDGIEFVPRTGSVALFGKRGGSPKVLLIRSEADRLVGMSVRSGAWVDALQLHFQAVGGGPTNAWSSDWYGGSGGGRREIGLPPGQMAIGVWGEVALSTAHGDTTTAHVNNDHIRRTSEGVYHSGDTTTASLAFNTLPVLDALLPIDCGYATTGLGHSTAG
ncbi:hypothetical protein FISHEDRAFT_71277 [Fistulina hepatica ATCC 64428]|nr:hypothetical protein FISHEDRAFT_71277 [Fistulina hepatica ATCC 64428]